MENFITVISRHFSNYEFFYIFLFCSFIFFLFAVFIKNKTLRIINIIFCSVFFALGASEFILSLGINLNDKTALETLQYSKDIIDGNNAVLIVSEQEKLKLKIPYTDIRWDAQDKFYKNGFRYTQSNQSSKQGYVFLGCSFTYGDSVNHNETLPYYFSKLMNFEKKVLNCGVCSRGSNTALNILNSDIIEKIMGNTKIEHFFYILISDQVDRNFRLFARDSHDIWILNEGRWSLAKSPFLKVKLFFSKSLVFKKIFLKTIDNHNKKFYDNYLLESIEKMRKIAVEKYGSKLTVAVFPGYDTKVEGNTVYIPRSLDKYRAVDGNHPGPKANEETAKLLYKHISETDI